MGYWNPFYIGKNVYIEWNHRPANTPSDCFRYESLMNVWDRWKALHPLARETDGFDREFTVHTIKIEDE